MHAIRYSTSSQVISVDRLRWFCLPDPISHLGMETTSTTTLQELRLVASRGLFSRSLYLLNWKNYIDISNSILSPEWDDANELDWNADKMKSLAIALEFTEFRLRCLRKKKRHWSCAVGNSKREKGTHTKRGIFQSRHLIFKKNFISWRHSS